MRKHHPDAHCYVLVIDEWRGFIKPEEESFTIISLTDLPLPEATATFCFKYDLTELATAVKPLLLIHLFEKHDAAAVIYFDPDILVTASLDSLFARVSENAVTLTPHLDAAPPDDGNIPSDSSMLIAGIFNLGFLGVNGSAEARRFLRWLAEKLRDNCVIEPARGFFVDQRFVDWGFLLFNDVHVERDTAYNVAYWNLHSRVVTRDHDGTWLCNGRPLRFYHFSNFNPNRPGEISGYQNRFRLHENPQLSLLFDEYRKLLLRNGYDTSCRWPYTFASFRYGQCIPYGLRWRFRSAPYLRNHIADPFDSVILFLASVPVRLVNCARQFFRH